MVTTEILKGNEPQRVMTSTFKLATCLWSCSPVSMFCHTGARYCSSCPLSVKNSSKSPLSSECVNILVLVSFSLLWENILNGKFTVSAWLPAQLAPRTCLSAPSMLGLKTYPDMLDILCRLWGFECRSSSWQRKCSYPLSISSTLFLSPKKILVI